MELNGILNQKWVLNISGYDVVQQSRFLFFNFREVAAGENLKLQSIWGIKFGVPGRRKVSFILYTCFVEDFTYIIAYIKQFMAWLVVLDLSAAVYVSDQKDPSIFIGSDQKCPILEKIIHELQITAYCNRKQEFSR